MIDIDAYFEEQLKPSTRLAPVEWCEQNIYFPRMVSESYPGFFNVRSMPYLAEPLEVMTRGEQQDVALCFGAQSGKTTLLMLAYFYTLDQDPSNAIWMMPNDTLAKSFSKDRFVQMLKASDTLKRHMPTERNKINISEMQFNQSVLNFIGSNSAGNIASRPCSLGIFDEVDKFGESTSKEASAYALGQERTKMSPKRRHWTASTPTLDSGTIWKEFLAGDQRYFFLPCPHCGELGVLGFRDREDKKFPVFTVRTPDSAKTRDGWNLRKVIDSTYLNCTHCEGKVEDTHKPKMLLDGKWIATNAEEAHPEKASFHLSSLYSPNVTFGQFAMQFFKEKNYLDGLRNFINSWCAEPFYDEFEKAQDRAIEVQSDFKRRDDWADEVIRLIGCDVQKDTIYWVCRAIDDNGNSRLVDHGRCSTVEELEETRISLKVDPDLLCIDSGFKTNEVYRWCWLYGWTPIKGEDKQGYIHRVDGIAYERVYSELQSRPVYGVDTISGQPGEVYAMHVASQTIQDHLRFFMDSESPKWQIPYDVDGEYLNQLKSHVKKRYTCKKTGKEIYRWEKKHQKADDHYFDCECYLLALALYGNLILSSASDAGIDEETEPEEEET